LFGRCQLLRPICVGRHVRPLHLSHHVNCFWCWDVCRSGALARTHAQPCWGPRQLPFHLWLAFQPSQMYATSGIDACRLGRNVFTVLHAMRWNHNTPLNHTLRLR
jgi:hypothetical protein